MQCCLNKQVNWSVVTFHYVLRLFNYSTILLIFWECVIFISSMKIRSRNIIHYFKNPADKEWRLLDSEKKVCMKEVSLSCREISPRKNCLNKWLVSSIICSGFGFRNSRSSRKANVMYFQINLVIFRAVSECTKWAKLDTFTNCVWESNFMTNFVKTAYRWLWSFLSYMLYHFSCQNFVISYW